MSSQAAPVAGRAPAGPHTAPPAAHTSAEHPARSGPSESGNPVHCVLGTQVV